MSSLDTINQLLDAAKEKTGSDYKTAQLLGQPFQQISNWRHGHKTAQPEDHALVAALAGLDAEEALVRAVIAKHANKPKGERLMSALGNVLRRTGEVVTLGFFASAVWGLVPGGSAEARASAEPTSATMCIMLNDRSRRIALGFRQLSLHFRNPLLAGACDLCFISLSDHRLNAELLLLA